MISKPMLAASTKSEDLRKLPFPLYGSWKLDGIRALVVNGRLVSRAMKVIPNRHVQALFGRPEYEGFDGELTVGPITDKNLMQATTSGVMSYDGKPDVTYHVFDNWKLHPRPWIDRFRATAEQIKLLNLNSHVAILPHWIVKDYDALIEFEQASISEGFEGVCLRKPTGLYKEGRSTLSQGWLLKVKRFTDGEARVIGFTELVRKDGSAGGCLGNLKVRDLKTGVEFEVGTGYTQAQRDEFWTHRDAMVEAQLIIKYQHFVVGSVDKPRFPIFVGFRHPDDL